MYRIMPYSFRLLLFQSVLASLMIGIMIGRGSGQAPVLLAFSCLYLLSLCFIECIGARIKGNEKIVWILALDLNKENKECRASLCCSLVRQLKILILPPNSLHNLFLSSFSPYLTARLKEIITCNVFHNQNRSASNPLRNRTSKGNRCLNTMRGMSERDFMPSSFMGRRELMDTLGQKDQSRATNNKLPR